MDFEIIPYSSIGPITFGMTRDEVHQSMGDPSYTDLQWGETVPTDYYGEFRIQVFYNQSNRCNAVQLSLPSNPTFKNKNLLKRLSIGRLKTWFEDMGVEVSMSPEQCGFIVFEFGISFYTEDYNLFKKKRPQSILIFEKGYYST